MAMPIITRIGLPDARPAYVNAAARLGLPVLFSASAFAKPWTREMRDNDEPHPGVRFTRQIGERLKALDCAMDSAGYTAMARFDGYVWSVEQYVELAGDIAGTTPCRLEDLAIKTRFGRRSDPPRGRPRRLATLPPDSKVLSERKVTKTRTE